MNNLDFGADPEVFCVYGENFVLSPALMEKDLGILPLNESVKHPVYIKTQEYSWMMDGVAWELTLLSPHKSLTDVWKIMRTSLDHLQEFISNLSHPKLGKLSLCKNPVVNISPNIYLPHLDYDEKVYQGFIFGCDPDEDAIDPLYECRTLDVSSHPFRYGGGHLHISGIENLAPKPMIRLLACTVGNFAIANSPVPELEKLRTQTYGRPGRFRFQTYKNGAVGVEYRTPSNSWITFPEEKIEEMEFWARKAVDLLGNPRKGMEILNEYLEETCKAIVLADQNSAGNILNQLV